MQEAAKTRAQARALLWGDDTYGKFLFGEMILGCLGFLLSFVVGICVFVFKEAVPAETLAVLSQPVSPDASRLAILKDFVALLTPQALSLAGALAAVILLALVYILGFSGWSGHAMAIASVRRGLAVSHALSGWGHGWRMAGLLVRQMLSVFLWSCLLVAPGVRKLFALVLAPYLLVDHPDWSISRCLAESERLMEGHRLAWFKLTISFAGWYLGAFVLEHKVPFIGKFAQILLAPYPETAFALFYEARLDATEPLAPAPSDEPPAETPAAAEPPPAETSLYSKDEYDHKDDPKDEEEKA